MNDSVLIREFQFRATHVIVLEESRAGLFDANGRKLEMVTDGSTVRIRPAEDQPTDAEYFRTRLREVLMAVGKHPADSASIDELLRLFKDAGLVYRQ